MDILSPNSVNLDAEGRVESVLDAGAALEVYREGCKAAGYPEPDVIGA